MSDLSDYALPQPRDTRPQRGGWAPGLYACTCGKCGAEFTGDKGATVCAACAYGEESGNHDRAGEIMDAIVLTGYDARVQELFAAEITAATERGRQAGLIEAAEIAETRHLAWQADEGTTVCCDVTACEDIADVIRARANAKKEPS